MKIEIKRENKNLKFTDLAPYTLFMYHNPESSEVTDTDIYLKLPDQKCVAISPTGYVRTSSFSRDNLQVFYSVRIGSVELTPIQQL